MGVAGQINFSIYGMHKARMLVALAASFLTMSSAWSTTIEATNLCDANCSLKDVALDFPETVDGFLGANFNFSVKAEMMQNMSFSWRHQITVLTGPSPADIEVWNSTGVPCGYTFVGDPVWLQLYMNFPDCHATTGHVEMLGAVKFHGVILPGVPVVAHVHMWDDRGNPALKIQIRLHHPIFSGASISEVQPKPNAQQLQPQQNVHRSTDISNVQPSMHFPRTTITASDCCDLNCRLKNVSLNFPHHLDGFEMNFNVTGELDREISDIRYNVHGVLEVFDILPSFTVLVANGSLCGYTTISDHTEFKIGVDPGSCPFAAGDYLLAGWVRFIAFPFDWLGNVSLRVEVVEENSDQRVACADVNLHVGLSTSDNIADLPLLV